MYCRTGEHGRCSSRLYRRLRGGVSAGDISHVVLRIQFYGCRRFHWSRRLFKVCQWRESCMKPCLVVLAFCTYILVGLLVNLVQHITFLQYTHCVCGCGFTLKHIYLMIFHLNSSAARGQQRETKLELTCFNVWHFYRKIHHLNPFFARDENLSSWCFTQLLCACKVLFIWQ